MDAYVQIALIEKIRMIFVQDAKLFLSFPLMRPINYQPESLAALIAPTTPADYAAAADFARTVNFVPRDMVAGDDGESLLWDVYLDVLQHAEHATGISDPQAEARRENAARLLYSVDADNLRHETAAYLTYRQYRDAWLVAQQNYNAQKITATSSDDDAIKRHWTDEVEPQLRAAVDQALVDLENIGRKAEIENALAVLASEASKSPGAQWDAWKASFNPDIDMSHADAIAFAPTGYSPIDIAEGSSWVKTELTAAEMATLVSASAHAGLAGSPGEVTGVSLEFRSVTLTRPWFDPQVLPSRIWRGSAGMEPLSDGADQPSGRLPAYVTALVLVRNIAVTTSQAASPAPVTGKLDFQIAAQMFTERKLAPMIMARAIVPSADPEPPAADTRAFSRLRNAGFSTAAEAAVLASPRIEAQAMRRIAITSLADSPAIAAESPKVAMFRAARFPIGLRDVVGLDRDPPVADPVPPVPEPPPPPPPPDTSISILAFICRRLPKAPDPAPGLTWA